MTAPAPDPRTRVVVVSIDAYPAGRLAADVSPVLWELSEASRRVWDHGWAGMTTMTYASHAALLTGVGGDVNGVPMNQARVDGQVRKLTDGYLRAPTVFGAVAAARPNARTAAVLGDQHLAQLLLTEGAAGTVWPPTGEHRDVPTDGIGDTFDAVVIDEALRVLADDDPDLLLVHLNDTDLWGHFKGPDDEEAVDRRRQTDVQLGRLLDALASSPRWRATTVVCVSDHDMLPVAHDGWIDLPAALADAGLGGLGVVADGGAATVWVDDERRRTPDAGRVVEAARAIALAIDGVAEAWLPQSLPGASDDHLVASARPEWRCASPMLGDLLVVTDDRHAFVDPRMGDFRLEAVHGQPGASRALAAVGGGDERLRPAADCGPIDAADWPRAIDWAPTVAALLGVPPPAASAGRVVHEVIGDGAVAPLPSST